MRESFKINVYFDEEGEKIERIIASYILKTMERNSKNLR